MNGRRDHVLMKLKSIAAGVLTVAYREYGPAKGWPCIMGHGFPYDVHAYSQIAPILAEAGARVIVPYLRGYGPTLFLSPETMRVRSGEQAALGVDLLLLMDALGIERAVVGGYDWGGRAACIVSAIWPERVAALISGNSYNIQNIARALEPAPPSQEAAFWYQYYFHSERGRRGLTKDRRGIARQLWGMWSPTWNFDDVTFGRTAKASAIRTCVEVVIHSLSAPLMDFYQRFRRCGYRGAPKRAQPPDRRTCNHHRWRGGRCGSWHGASREPIQRWARHRIFRQTGHNLPQERPEEWARAVLDARAMARQLEG